MNNNCLATSIIYEASISPSNSNGPPKKYIGLCETTFKKRYANHKQSFNFEKYKHSTALSTEFWKLKDANSNPQVTWKILRTAQAFKPETKKCHLCNMEKFEIAYNENPDALLNRRSEIVNKCRHQRKYDGAMQWLTFVDVTNGEKTI